MKTNKYVYCYFELSECDDTNSAGKSWKNIFLNYFTHILQKSYRIQLKFLDSPDELPDDSKDNYFLYLKVFGSEAQNTPVSTTTFSTCFNHCEYIALIKNPLQEQGWEHYQCFRIFDCCPIDAETNLPVRTDELFEEENMHDFLSKVSNLAFEIELLFFSDKNSTRPVVYLAEAPYELTLVRYSVKKELIRRGYNVLPETVFPDQEALLIQHIRNDLKKAVLSVHFFGSDTSLPHPITGMEMDEFQNKLAAAYFKEQQMLVQSGDRAVFNYNRIIWLPENIRIRNEKHQKLLEALKKNPALYNGADLIRSSAEELKDIILEKIKRFEPLVPASTQNQENTPAHSKEDRATILTPPAVQENSVQEENTLLGGDNLPLSGTILIQ
jgi:hypothetical protein